MGVAAGTYPTGSDDPADWNAADLITYYAGSTVPVLISPDGEIYPLVSRDAQRTTDESPIPTGWTVVEHTFTEDYTTRLPNPTLNIRVENQDSYQGPVTGLEIEP